MNKNRTKNAVRIIPLGGMYEIGKNMTAIECGEDIIIVDCGIAFPEEELLGIDAVIPDFTYLKTKKDKIRGLVLTHGHEDHIGAVPYLLKEIDMPVFGSRLTNGILKNKFEEHGIDGSKIINNVEPGDTITLGLMRVEFIRITHSIAGAFSLAIFTPVGTIIHTGDFKVDFTPIEGEPMDFARFAELGKQGVDLLLCDSTNAERPGMTMSEKSVGVTFEQIFVNATGRVIVATFASNIHRIQQILDAAVKFKRKVTVCGRSMERVVAVAIELGYLKIPNDIMIEIDHINKYRDDQLVLLTTGSQGEPMSALTRIANKEHRKVQIKHGDLVIISASPIPGNERTVSNVINQLFIRGAEVIYDDLMDVHVSGHACQEELKLMQCLVKPKYFMPVHGEYRHLIQNGALAISMGKKYEDVIIAENGDIVELTKTKISIAGSVPHGRILIDGLGVGDVGSVVLKDRKILSEDGLIIVVAGIDPENNTLVTGPEIISRGFVYMKEAGELIEMAKRVVEDTFSHYQRKKKHDLNILKNNIRDNLRDLLYENTKRRPMILSIIMEV